MKAKVITFGALPVLAVITFLFWGMTISCATSSMLPTLDCHNKVGMKYLFPDQRSSLSVGDIVAYSPTLQQRYIARQQGITWDTTFVLHRIVGINSTGYIIQGDSNEWTDNSIYGNIKPYQVSYIVRKIK
jgi:hypothetical protein